MISLHESGILQHLKARHFRQLREDHCGPEFTAGSSALGVTDVWPIFAIIGSGVIAAIVCLLIETVARKWKKYHGDDVHVHGTEPNVEDSQMSQINFDTEAAVPSTSNAVTDSQTAF